jgi:hypothetical protein
MKRTMNHMGVESFNFRADNKLKIFPPNSFKFNLNDHIIIDEVQNAYKTIYGTNIIKKLYDINIK